MENPVHWFNREIGRSSTEWKLRHWAVFVAVVGAFSAYLIGYR